MSWPASSARCSSPIACKGYAEARRVLTPGGRFVFNVWDRIEDNDFADVVTQALADSVSRRSAALHGAHAARLSRPRLIRSDLERAGFADIAIEGRRSRQPCALAARCRGRLLPGHAAAQRDRGARRTRAGSSDRRGRTGTGAALWQRRDQGPDSRAGDLGGATIRRQYFAATADGGPRSLQDCLKRAAQGLVAEDKSACAVFWCRC